SSTHSRPPGTQSSPPRPTSCWSRPRRRTSSSPPSRPTGSPCDPGALWASPGAYASACRPTRGCTCSRTASNRPPHPSTSDPCRSRRSDNVCSQRLVCRRLLGGDHTAADEAHHPRGGHPPLPPQGRDRRGQDRKSVGEG